MLLNISTKTNNEKINHTNFIIIIRLVIINNYYNHLYSERMRNKLSFRELLTLILVLFSMSMIFFILKNWGSEKEILTLIIGLLGGTILGSITGTYYGSSHKNHSLDNENKQDETNN